MPKRFDYTKSRVDIFYKVIYPLFAKEFLFGNDYSKFADKVNSAFSLNAIQWQYILKHWEEKEAILL